MLKNKSIKQKLEDLYSELLEEYSNVRPDYTYIEYLNSEIDKLECITHTDEGDTL